MLRTTILFIIISKCASQTCHINKTVDISSGVHLSGGEIDFQNMKFKKLEYVIVDKTERACICDRKVCVLKCCEHGYGYDSGAKGCVITNSTFHPIIRDEYLRIQDEATMYYRIGRPNCTGPEFRILVGDIYRDYHLRTDGKLYIAKPTSIPPSLLLTPDKYCIDTVMTEDENGQKITRMDALACFKEDERETYIARPACMLISCVFIMATVIVYAWLPELRNMYGRVLIAYLLCLLVGFSCLATMQILLTMDNTSTNICVGLTITIYFSLLAAFFWMNVMSFDIWWTFRFRLYLKLFSVMSSNWLLEVFSACYPEGNYLWIDAYNALFGLIIFILFVCKRKLFHLLMKRCKLTRGGINNTSKSQTVSTRTLRSAREEIALETIP